MLPAAHSLVKYENPIRLLKDEDDNIIPLPCKQAKIDEPEEGTTEDEGEAPKRDTLEEILDSFIPPTRYEEKGETYILAVSRAPATRQSVLNLNAELKFRAETRQARKSGLCPIRRELYDDCFNELVRQSAVECAERGLLFVRIRDELKMTLETYESLMDSSVVYGLHKAAVVESERGNADEVLAEVRARRDEARFQRDGVRFKQEQQDKDVAEAKKVVIALNEERINFLRKSNAQLKDQIDLIAAKK